MLGTHIHKLVIKYKDIFIFFCAANNNCRSEPREDQRLYWMAVSRLPPFEAEHEVYLFITIHI